jgi:hypothetical protein
LDPRAGMMRRKIETDTAGWCCANLGRHGDGEVWVCMRHMVKRLVESSIGACQQAPCGTTYQIGTACAGKGVAVVQRAGDGKGAGAGYASSSAQTGIFKQKAPQRCIVISPERHRVATPRGATRRHANVHARSRRGAVPHQSTCSDAPG